MIHFTCVYTYIAWHDKSHSFLHIARTPTNPVSNPWSQETNRPAWQVPQRRDVSLLSPLWPWGEEATTEGEERPESRTQSRWCTPWMTRWRHRHMTRAAGWWIRWCLGRGWWFWVKCALKDGATKMPVGLQKWQKIVHEIWPTEVECKCYKWSRFFGEASQDGYSFHVYCNPPCGKIGWGVFPVSPAGCIPGHEIFFGARSLVVRSDSGCCRFNRATVVSSFSTA